MLQNCNQCVCLQYATCSPHLSSRARRGGLVDLILGRPRPGFARGGSYDVLPLPDWQGAGLKPFRQPGGRRCLAGAADPLRFTWAVAYSSGRESARAIDYGSRIVRMNSGDRSRCRRDFDPREHRTRQNLHQEVRLSLAVPGFCGYFDPLNPPHPGPVDNPVWEKVFGQMATSPLEGKDILPTRERSSRCRCGYCSVALKYIGSPGGGITEG